MAPRRPKVVLCKCVADSPGGNKGSLTRRFSWIMAFRAGALLPTLLFCNMSMPYLDDKTKRFYIPNRERETLFVIFTTVCVDLKKCERFKAYIFILVPFHFINETILLHRTCKPQDNDKCFLTVFGGKPVSSMRDIVLKRLGWCYNAKDWKHCLSKSSACLPFNCFKNSFINSNMSTVIVVHINEAVRSEDEMAWTDHYCSYINEIDCTETLWLRTKIVYLKVSRRLVWLRSKSDESNVWNSNKGLHWHRKPRRHVFHIRAARR